MRLFSCIVALLLPFAAAFAQGEWTYVVTGKAGKDGVQVYDTAGNPVMRLKKGEEIWISGFYDDYPSWDGSAQVRKAAVFTKDMEDYVIILDEEGLIVPKSRYRYERIMSGFGDMVSTFHGKNYWALLFAAVYLVLMFFGVDEYPPLGRIRSLRDLRVLSEVEPNGWVLSGVSGWVYFGVYLAALAGESYFLLTSSNPFWFMGFSESGLVKGLLFLALMIAYLYAKYTVTCVALYPLKQTRLLQDSRFNYKTAVLIVFVGSWLILSMTYWKGGYVEYLVWAVAAACLVGVVWVMRKALRQAGLLLSLVMLAVVFVGGASLCYVACEVFSKVIQIIVACFCVYAVFSALGSSSHSSSGDSDHEMYVDPDGNARDLYRQPDGTYVDYSDNSRFNRRNGANGPRFDKIR